MSGAFLALKKVWIKSKLRNKDMMPKLKNKTKLKDCHFPSPIPQPYFFRIVEAIWW